MNEISNQIAVHTAKAISLTPQVRSQKSETDVSTKEAKVQESGELLPEDEQIMAAEVTSVEVKEAVSKLNEHVQSTQRDLDFKLDEESGQTVIRVYDRQSEQLVRQIPNEVALDMAKKLNSEEPLMLFNAQI